ncbi:hypothetical protein AG1IA_03431 [Rhizoctonia solani AG-1 IA]|uniref:Uncharacterized protein n=1 Tax=Thanatephorus cucumeris (strain AG1-IA) TaxID=983506 RepID=L8WWR9_THACA|nr:hypothetical protein AG1IA_03431 [Rhizoctonia solani AG-1 IA]
MLCPIEHILRLGIFGSPVHKSVGWVKTHRVVRNPPDIAISLKTAKFYATLLFGGFITLAGVFGIVAEAVTGGAYRWLTSAAFAMRALGLLIAQLAMVQLLTPDYLLAILSVDTPTITLPTWRIYAVILAILIASVSSLISVFVVPQVPSLISSAPTLVSLSLPTPLLFSLMRAVKSSRSNTENKRSAPTMLFNKPSKCVELGLPTPGTVGEVVEGAFGRRVPVVWLLSSMGLVIWGGGVMPTRKFVMAPSVDSTVESSWNLGRVSNQPSEDFMTLKDPFASPTQAGFPLSTSPLRTVAPRRPRRRASEPLQLRRFGSFAVLAEDVKEKQAGSEEDQDTSFLEDLVRHAWFSTGRTDCDSIRNNFHEYDRPPSTPVHAEDGALVTTPTTTNSSSTVATRKESPGPSETASPLVLASHTFRPVTPPRPRSSFSQTFSRDPKLPDLPTPFPLLSTGVERSLLPNTSVRTSAYTVPSSPASSESGSSFVSPPPTPTPRPPSHHLPLKAPKSASEKYPCAQDHGRLCP